jgi:hypothetical protein
MYQAAPSGSLVYSRGNANITRKVEVMQVKRVYSYNSQCHMKRGYKRRREALKALKQTLTVGAKNPGKLTVYRCGWCGLHHLGNNHD